MRSICLQIAILCEAYAISYFDTFKWTSGESGTTFFGANSKSKIGASVDGAYASQDKK